MCVCDKAMGDIAHVCGGLCTGAAHVHVYMHTYAYTYTYARGQHTRGGNCLAFTLHIGRSSSPFTPLEFAATRRTTCGQPEDCMGDWIAPKGIAHPISLRHSYVAVVSSWSVWAFG